MGENARVYIKCVDVSVTSRVLGRGVDTERVTGDTKCVQGRPLITGATKFNLDLTFKSSSNLVEATCFRNDAGGGRDQTCLIDF